MDPITALIIAGAIWLAFQIGRFSVFKDIADIIIDGERSPAEAEREEILTIEQHDQGYFAYSESGEFVAHDQSCVAKLLDRVAERFPDRTWRIEQPNMEELGLTMQELEDKYQQRRKADQQ